MKEMRSYGIAAIVIKKRKFLLLEDSRDAMSGYWGPPHGRCTPEDLSEQDCVAREVLEETNLNVRPTKKLWTTKADIKVESVSFWLVEVLGGNIQTDTKETRSYGWFTTDGALKLKLYPGTKRFFTLLKENRIQIL